MRTRLLQAAFTTVAIAAGTVIGAQPALADPPVFAIGDYRWIDYGPDATFTFDTNSSYWSAFVLTMVTGGADLNQKPDFNLKVARTDTGTAVTSKYGIMEPDFVAIDANRPACSDKQYRADVTFNAGSREGAYTVTLAQGSDALPTRTLPLSGSDLAPNGRGSGPGRYPYVVRDVYLTGGRKTEVWGLNSTPEQTSRVWVMNSSDKSCMVSRSERIASGNLPAGKVQGKAFAFTPPRTGWYGIVNLGYCCKSDDVYDSLTVAQAKA